MRYLDGVLPAMAILLLGGSLALGVVHLGGFVWSVSDLLLAQNLAASVPGVRAVSDEMELMRGGGRK